MPRIEVDYADKTGGPGNPEDSLTISRGVAADRPVPPGKYTRREILKESFISVAFKRGYLSKRFITVH